MDIFPRNPGDFPETNSHIVGMGRFFVPRCVIKRYTRNGSGGNLHIVAYVLKRPLSFLGWGRYGANANDATNARRVFLGADTLAMGCF